MVVPVVINMNAGNPALTLSVLDLNQYNVLLHLKFPGLLQEGQVTGVASKSNVCLALANLTHVCVLQVKFYHDKQYLILHACFQNVQFSVIPQYCFVLVQVVFKLNVKGVMLMLNPRVNGSRALLTSHVMMKAGMILQQV